MKRTDKPMQDRWFANRRKGTYHREGADWVREGTAVCGADISRPRWTTVGKPAAPLKTCKHCEKKQA